MRLFNFSTAISIAAIVAGFAIVGPVATPALAAGASASELDVSIRGKICLNEVNTRISFGRNGFYEWIGGLTGTKWTGKYHFEDGRLVVDFGGGNVRSFRMSHSGDAFFVDNDQLTC